MSAPRPRDPVVGLANELVPLEREYYAIVERQGGTSGSERIYLDTYLSEVDDRIDAIEDRMAAIKATSLTGALTQVRLAYWRLVQTYDTDGMAEGPYRRISRLLYSAAEVLEAETGTPRDKLAGEYHMPLYLDPYRTADERLAAADIEIEPAGTA